MEAGTGEPVRSCRARFLLPTLPGKSYRGCPSTPQDPPSLSGPLGTWTGFAGFKLQSGVGAAGEGRLSRVEQGTCHPISVVRTSAEQLPCSPCRPPAGRSRAWPGDPACCPRARGGKADGSRRGGRGFLLATGGARRGLAPYVCAFSVLPASPRGFWPGCKHPSGSLHTPQWAGVG